jgi:2-C-methyl-D-erythritol 4-phosphate cytidylyltransferase
MNYAVIVAAGSGTRFASDTSKTFASLNGRALILRTLRRFEDCLIVDAIVLVLSEEGRAEFDKLDYTDISKLKPIVIGGDTRAASVRNGIDAIEAWDVDIIAVHDGARPLVTSEEIARTIETAQRDGAACLVAEVTDTIKQVDGGTITGTVDRRTLRRALTPQAFRADILKKAFENAELGSDVTDECYLVEKLGLPITAVEGSSRNIKITRSEDLELAELYLRNEK